MSCSYASAITAMPARCRRFVDDSTPGSSARVCGAPIFPTTTTTTTTAAGRAGSYCPACIPRLTARAGSSRPRVPRGPIADPWVMPTEAELEEAFG